MGGYFKVDRALQNHWLWEQKPFSQGQAWIDLLGLAAFEDHHVKFGVRLTRGQLFTTLRALGERWGWSPHKVTSFIGVLKSFEMILENSSKNGNNKGTIITIANYCLYQDIQKLDGSVVNKKGTQKEHRRNTEGTQKEQSTYVIEGSEGSKEGKLFQVESMGSDFDAFAAEFLAYWNANAAKYIENKKQVFVGCAALTDKRSKLLRARFKEKFFRDNWKAAIDDMINVAFLSGSNDRGWTATAEYFLKPDSVVKIIEGYYDRRGKAADTVTNEFGVECDPDTGIPLEVGKPRHEPSADSGHQIPY